MKVFSVGEMLIDFLPGSEAGTTFAKRAARSCKLSNCTGTARLRYVFSAGCWKTMILVASCWRHYGKIMSRRSCLTDEAVTTMAFVTLDEQGHARLRLRANPGADMLLTREQVQCGCI